METEQIQEPVSQITYSLTRKKVKNINLRIRPDASVVVSASRAVPSEQINRLIREKAGWIKKQQDMIKATARVREEWESEDAAERRIYYLGIKYPLQFSPAERDEKVLFSTEAITVCYKEQGGFRQSYDLLRRAYLEEAKIILPRSLSKMYRLVSPYQIALPSLTIRTMKTRWGSCSWSKGKITLNSELIKSPQSCIDYVVLHELAHFIHHRHDQAFYRFIAELMPDWQVRREALRAVAAGDQIPLNL